MRRHKLDVVYRQDFLKSHLYLYCECMLYVRRTLRPSSCAPLQTHPIFVSHQWKSAQCNLEHHISPPLLPTSASLLGRAIQLKGESAINGMTAIDKLTGPLLSHQNGNDQFKRFVCDIRHATAFTDEVTEQPRH